MKNFLLVLVALILTTISGRSQGIQTLTKISGYNAYVYYPVGYEKSFKNWPLMLFFPGVGEAGTDASKLLNYGPNKYAVGLQPEMLIISVQPTYAWMAPAAVNKVITDIISSFRVDTNKIVLTGLSAGGTNIEQYALTPGYSNRIAGIIPMSAPEVSTYYKYIPEVAPLPWGALGFSGTQDSHTEKMRDLFTRLGQAYPGKSLFITANYGHCCWNQYYDPSYKIGGIGCTLYEWAILQNKAVPVFPSDTVIIVPPTVLTDTLKLVYPYKMTIQFLKDGQAIYQIIK